MPADTSSNTCDKDSKNCEQVIVPSRILASENSADIRIVRPMPGGGEVEVRVVIAPK